MKRALLGVAALSLALSACGTSNDRASSTDAPDTTAVAPSTAADAASTGSGSREHQAGHTDDHEATVTAPPRAVADVKVSPGQADDGFVGAASDAKLETCAKTGTEWKAGGSVKNPTAGAATYRIYVAMNAVGTTETRALKQVDVSTKPGETKQWATTAPVSGKLSCILRVERVAKS